MTPEIEALPFDQLRTLHREVGALIAQRRHSELEELKQRAALLGFTAVDLAPPTKQKGNGHLPPKFGDGNGNFWSGKGKPPTWMKDLLEQGHAKEEYAL